MSIKEWFWACLLSLDQSVNVFLGPPLNKMLDPLFRFGNEDETLSSVLGKNVRSGSCKGCYWTCRALHLLDKNHCLEAIEEDEGNPPAH